MFIKFLNSNINLSTVGSYSIDHGDIYLTFPEWVFIGFQGHDSEEWDDGEGEGWDITQREEGGIEICFTKGFPEYAKIKKFLG